MPADRGDRSPWAGHAALRPDEACGIDRSAHRTDALRSSPVAAGKPAGRFLQPGWIPESFEVRRAGAGAAADSRPGECAIPALRTDSPQYVYQCADLVARYLADEGASTSLLRRADLRRGGLRRVDRH